MNKIQNELIEFYRALMNDACESNASRLEAASQLQNMSYQMDQTGTDAAVAYQNTRAALLNDPVVLAICRQNGMVTLAGHVWTCARTKEQVEFLRKKLNDDFMFNAVMQAVEPPRAVATSPDEDLTFPGRVPFDAEPKTW